MLMDENTRVAIENYEADCNIAKLLPHTWDAFFQAFGRLKPVQRLVIPEIVKGEDLLVLSGTASGKTEASCAPLIERHFKKKIPWTILYISPTRALVNDLYHRLYTPCERLHIDLARKTSDYQQKFKYIPNILLTTPESFDSLLCRNKRDDKLGHDLAHVVAVVLDEVHLLYGSPRGEQILWLLERLKRLRKLAESKEWTNDSNVQIIGLSATVSDPEGVVKKYFPENTKHLQFSSSRAIEAIAPPSEYTDVKSALKIYLSEGKCSEKVLVFCNSRKRVDELASYFKTILGKIGYEVRAHHGSLSKNEREETEDAVKSKDKIVVFATSTLEIGVDIGDIDLVVLDGPAPDISSFLQRVGRGNRRTDNTRVLACADSVQDLIIQNSIIDAASSGWLGNDMYGPQYSVIRQQIASYIFQSPTLTRQRSRLQYLFKEPFIEEKNFDSILNNMIYENELVALDRGIKLGEFWEHKLNGAGIHSTIESSYGASIVDSVTGQKIATGVHFRGGNGLNIGGKALEVRKWNERKVEVKTLLKSNSTNGDWSYVSSSMFASSSQPAAVKKYLGIPENVWPLIRKQGHLYAFHFGGARSSAIIDYLRREYATSPNQYFVNDWYLRVNNEAHKPKWIELADPNKLNMSLYTDDQLFNRIEKTLHRPYSNKKLPKDVRISEILGWLDINNQCELIKNSKWQFMNDEAVSNVLKSFVQG